jgi:hypothetical protein
VKDLIDWLYWSWAGVITAAILWGGFLLEFKPGFWWSLAGSTVLLLIVQLLRWVERRRAVPSDAGRE